MRYGGLAVRPNEKSRPAVAGRASLVRFGLLSLSIATAVIVWIGWYGGGEPSDARSFYDPTYGRVGIAYIWSPAFAQITTPLRLLPLDVFVGLVRGLEIAAIVAIAPYGAWLALFLPPVAAEVNAANINMLLILCVVASLRYPWAWTLPLLTKPSMALALAYHLPRREWRTLVLAVVPAVVIAAVSFALDPQAWITYIATLTTFGDNPGWPFPVPIWPRIPIAVAVALWGGATGRRWALPLAALIALPRLYFMSPAMLLGVIPLSRGAGRAGRGSTTWSSPPSERGSVTPR